MGHLNCKQDTAASSTAPAPRNSTSTNIAAKETKQQRTNQPLSYRAPPSLPPCLPACLSPHVSHVCYCLLVSFAAANTKPKPKPKIKEGHCEQDGTLGGRAAGLGREKHGRLKWGVGKMIAHAPVTPVVIPLFHTGMAELIPINPFTRKILHAVPRTGNTVTARVGDEIRLIGVFFFLFFFIFVCYLVLLQYILFDVDGARAGVCVFPLAHMVGCSFCFF